MPLNAGVNWRQWIEKTQEPRIRQIGRMPKKSFLIINSRINGEIETAIKFRNPKFFFNKKRLKLIKAIQFSF